MLILCRNFGQSIVIHDTIRVYNMGVNRYGQVRFGIEAPPSVEVHRDEVYERIMAERGKMNNKVSPYCL